MVTVQLKDSTEKLLSGDVVRYNSGGWKAFGITDADGRVSKRLAGGTNRFRKTY